MKKNPKKVVDTLNIKFPMVVPIAGKDYILRLDSAANGATFSCRKQTINLGTHVSKAEFMQNIVHEVAEVILTERLYRYTKEKFPLNNGDYLFNMSHDQFEKFANDLAYAISKIFNL